MYLPMSAGANRGLGADGALTCLYIRTVDGAEGHDG